MTDRQFGRIPSSIDENDWILEDFEPRRLTFGVCQHAKWDFPSVPLDQEKTSHCVGFSGAHFGINLPTFTKFTKQDAHNFYYRCKVIDGDPGGEDGTTIRSLAKVLQSDGVIKNYAFAKSMESIRWWLLNKGPLIVGTIWSENMMIPDEDGMLDISGFVLGGHAYLINEITIDDRIGIKNSWGPNWGKNGKAYLTIDDFKALFYYGGEALAAVEVENYRTEEKHSCFLVDIISKILRNGGTKHNEV
jgi:hypothetical protein